MSDSGHFSLSPHSGTQVGEAAVLSNITGHHSKGKELSEEPCAGIKCFRSSTVLPRRTHELE